MFLRKRSENYTGPGTHGTGFGGLLTQTEAKVLQHTLQGGKEGRKKERGKEETEEKTEPQPGGSGKILSKRIPLKIH